MEDADQVHSFVLILRLLNVDKVLNTGTSVLNDTVDQSKSEVSELRLGMDVLNDGEEHSQEVLNLVFRVKDGALAGFVGRLEGLDGVQRSLGERVVAVCQRYCMLDTSMARKWC